MKDRRYRNEIIQDDVLRGLRALPDGCVQTVVTSPPYYGLRDYGTSEWYGGKKNCNHAFRPDTGRTTQRKGRRHQQGHVHIKCKCGAVRIDEQIGLENTPEKYVQRLVSIFREVRRVLRGDGTFWIVIGDSYAGSGKGAWDRIDRQKEVYISKPGGAEVSMPHVPKGLKRKDLMGIPWRLAFALQADGWWLRNEIIWHKPNPMTASATDRTTVAHETIFLLTKSANYFYDADAIRESFDLELETIMKTPDGWDTSVGNSGHGAFHRNGREKGYKKKLQTKGANRRSVWRIPTESYKGAHFATYPRRIPDRCIKAGTSEGGACSKCGKPLERVVEKGDVDEDWKKRSGADSSGEYRGKARKDFKNAKAQNASDVKRRILKGMRTKTTTGWRRGCDCKAKTVPCVVLDPFLGSGTTAAVAKRLGRDWIGIELSPKSVELARDRIRKTSFEPDMFRPRPERVKPKQADMF